jgi:IS30 family transposase
MDEEALQALLAAAHAQKQQIEHLEAEIADGFEAVMKVFIARQRAEWERDADMRAIRIFRHFVPNGTVEDFEHILQSINSGPKLVQ